MFPLSRPQRQVASTAAIVTLTILPTVYIAQTAWRIGRPGHVREVESELGRQLGLVVSLDSVRYPRPGEARYRGVVLKQEEPRRNGLVEVGRAREIAVRRGRRELTLHAEGLTLRGENPRQVLTQVGAALQKSGDGSIDRISLTADECSVDLGGGVEPFVLRDLVAALQTDRSAPAVAASYRMTSAGNQAGTRCELSLTRDRTTEPVRSTLVLKTMEGLPLPARVLDPFFDARTWLGPDATFEGTLTLRQEGTREWGAEFQGHLLDIDLATLVDRRFTDHRLKGKGRVSIDLARWGDRPGQGTGWLEARGELSAGPGVISLGLIQALSTEMQFRRGPRLARFVASTGVVDLDFRALAVRFAMTPDGEIRVTGGLGTEYDPDAVILGTTDPLAYAPEGAAHVRGLIKTLVPVKAINHSVMVPLTEKSRLLLCLPVGPDLAAKPIGGN
ncbi:MAG: hypothetical protein U0794_16935 [Isosphaeraceae bacterium]